MTAKDQIKAYIESQPEAKRSDMQTLHKLMLKQHPKCVLWFLDGKDAKGKVVSNPNIGYGTFTMRAAGGKSREFYRVGISANTTGISVYIMTIKDKSYLAATYGKSLGKASVTGYCIKFKALKDIDIEVLALAIRDGMEADVEAGVGGS